MVDSQGFMLVDSSTCPVAENMEIDLQIPVPEATYTVSGQLVNELTEQGFSGLLVEAIFKLDDHVRLQASAESGVEGGFSLEFSPDPFANLSPDDSVSVDFEVYRITLGLSPPGASNGCRRKMSKWRSWSSPPWKSR